MKFKRVLRKGRYTFEEITKGDQGYMYIIKNALRNIRRMFTKNILIAIIILIVGFSCVVSLSIKEAANTARQEGIDAVNITANISYDRQKMMQNMQPPTQGEQDGTSQEDMRDKMRESMQNQNLSLDELEVYAKADSVSDFYYEKTMTIGATEIEAIESSSSENFGGSQGMPGRSDEDTTYVEGGFSLVGISSVNALSDFTDGTKELVDGEYLDIEKTHTVMISEDLATYNSLEVGSSITLQNPNNESETYVVEVVGIYSQVSDQQMMMRQDPANQMYTSANTIDAIEAKTASDNPLTSQVKGTYVLADVDAYDAFSDEVYELGLSDDFTVQSMDVSMYEQSLAPLENLSSFADTFFLVSILVGGAILIVFQFLRVKDRVYEIGVLRAIGMSKLKISLQFICELLIITTVSLILALGIGAATSVPITNQLLENQSVSTNESEMQNMPGGMPQGMGGTQSSEPSGSFIEDSVQSVSSATNWTVVLEIMVIGLLLTIVSGGVATIFIQRYDTMKILQQS